MLADLTMPALLAMILLLTLMTVYLFSPDPGQRQRAWRLLRRLFRI